MKIGFFTDTYLPVLDGVVVSIESARKTLEAMGHEVFVFAPQVKGYKDKNKNVFRFKSIKYIKEPEYRYALGMFPVDKKIRDLINLKMDIAHAHSPLSLGILAKFISEKQKIPLVYTHHTHYEEYIKAYFKEKIVLPYLAKEYTRWFCNRSDLVIAPSKKFKTILEKYGVKKRVKIDILPTGIDLEKFNKKESRATIENIKKKYKISKDKKIVLTVGRINKEKNIEFLLKAWQHVVKKRDDVELVVVGEGKRLKEMKKKYSNANFVGAIPHNEMPAIYDTADLFAFASLAETQGLVILESMASGLPVVVLKDEAFSGVVKNNINGFAVESKSVVKFAEKLNQILDDKRLFKKFSENALLTADNFSEKEIANKLLKIYQGLINSKK
ncbi:MAG: glycosyltransferase [Patescibacteria group bacterium]